MTLQKREDELLLTFDSAPAFKCALTFTCALRACESVLFSLTLAAKPNSSATANVKRKLMSFIAT